MNVGLLAGCFVLGCVGTGGALRWRARRRYDVMRRALASEQIRWGAQVRELLPGGRRGVSGQLVISASRTVDLEPDAPSLKRGAIRQSWRVTDVQLTPYEHRRDLTGIRYIVVGLRPSGEPERKFGAFHVTGDLETECHG